MLRGVFGALAALCVLCASGCSWLQPDPELENRARQTYEAFRNGNVGPADLAMVTELQNIPAEEFAKVTALIPKSEPDRVRLIGYHQNHSMPEGSSTHGLSYEYHWSDRVALVTCSFFQASAKSPLLLQGFNFRMASREELKVNDFNLVGKPLGHYLMIFAIVASAAAMVVALVMSVRTPGVRRRWVWCIVSLVSVCKFNLDWTNNAFEWILLHVGVINLGVSRADTVFASWVLTAGLPVGAIVVIARLWRRSRSAAKNAVPPSTAA